MVHAQLEHAVARGLRQPGEAQRHAPLIVVAGGAGVGRRLPRQHVAQRFLGAGLADAAGDAGDPRARCAPRPARPRPSSAACVSATSTRLARIELALGHAADHGGGGAALEAPRRRRRARRGWGRPAPRTGRPAPACGCRSRRRTPTQSPARRAAGRRGHGLGGPERAHAACRRRRGGRAQHLGIVERQGPVADDLVVLVALAGDEQRVARPKRREGGPDRLRPVADLDARPVPPPAPRGGSRPGSSVRGLSSVTIASSASRAAISPISGRLPASRSPPQPNTTTSRPAVCGRSASSALASASGLWA